MRWARVPLLLLGLGGLFAAWFAIARRAGEAPMNSIPDNFDPLLVRTDFSDDTAWQTIRAGVLEVPPDLREGIEAIRTVNEAAGIDVSGYDQPVEFVSIIDERQNADRTTEEVVKLARKNDACIFVVDRQAISNADHPILVVEISHHRGRTFRTIPSEVWGIASNLQIANMDWEDFASRASQDGVFRGFPRSAP